MNRFQDKVAIVTGAASGIGLVTARRLAVEGARVVLVDRNGERLGKAADEVHGAGAPDVQMAECDVSVESEVEAAVNNAVSRFGRLDVIVNNAGMMHFKRLEEYTGEDWYRVLGVDLVGAFYFIKHAFLQMKNGGAIVNVSSIHAIQTTPMVAAYAAAKAGLLSLTRSAALEGKPKGIRTNAVLPGAIDTAMLWDNPNIKAGIEKLDSADVGHADNVAAAIAYLASDDAVFIQGACLNVDGGRLSGL